MLWSGNSDHHGMKRAEIRKLWIDQSSSEAENNEKRRNSETEAPEKIYVVDNSKIMMRRH